jgi:hypothetical protein
MLFQIVQECDTYRKNRWGNLKKKDHLNELGADGRIILIWYLGWGDVKQTGLIRRGGISCSVSKR